MANKGAEQQYVTRYISVRNIMYLIEFKYISVRKVCDTVDFYLCAEGVFFLVDHIVLLNDAFFVLLSNALPFLYSSCYLENVK
jgi:hypothetical protein